MARRRSRRRGSLRRPALLLFLLLAAALLALRLGGPALLQQQATAAVEASGLAPARFTLDWHGLAGLRLTDLRLGPSGAIAAESAELSFSLAALTRGRIAEILVTGLRVAAILDQEGRIGLKDLPAPAGDTAEPGLPALPLDAIHLRDAVITVETGFGQIAVQLDGHLAATALGLKATGEVAIEGPGWQIRAPELALDWQKQGWQAQLTGASAAVAAQQLALSGIEAVLEGSGEHAKLTARIAAVSDMARPARFVPLAATLEAERQGDGTIFALAARDAKALIEIKATGRHAIAARRGEAQITLASRSFHPGGAQPRDLFPALGGNLPPLAGQMTLTGPVTWSDRGLLPRLTLRLADVAADLGTARLSHGGLSLLLTALTPPGTPPGQVISGTIELGSDLTLPLEIQLQLRPAGVLAIESLRLGLADGTLELGDLTLDPRHAFETDLALPIHVRGVEIGALLRLLAIDGLSGEGKLDGLFPVRILSAGDKRLIFEQGHLDGRGAGALRYTGSGLPQQPNGSAGAESVALLRAALQDFHYESLTADVERDADGAGAITLHLDGTNPALPGARRFRLNIRLEANFDRLAGLLTAALGAAESLTRHAVSP